MRPTVVLLLGLFAAVPSYAKIVSEDVKYRDGEVSMVGLLVYDDAAPGKRPGVLVVHEWWGRVSFADEQARRLAEQGYVALAADVYGNHTTTNDPKEAGRLASSFKNDLATVRRRRNQALPVLAEHPRVDSSRLAAIGFCFGGTGVLELARSGADLRGVVSFHGGLGTAQPAEAGKIKARVLVLHGGDDPAVPWTEVVSFVEEMRKANASWELVAYGGAVHGFTNPANGTEPGRVAAYNPEVARRAWEACFAFLKEVFR
uniref:Dienelactone hydrolase family protein n=1 Tax=Thermoanaerobaculum aquaticum TaxID=1312852 RepID=A0A7V1ZHU3_9BACT